MRLLEHLPPQAISVVTNEKVNQDIVAGGAGILAAVSVGVDPWRPTLPGLRRLSRLVNLSSALRATRAISGLAIGGTILAVPWGGELGSELFVGAYLAHRRSGARLVIYEMDEWSDSLERGGISGWLLESIFHDRALRAASRIWAVSPSLAQRLEGRGVKVDVLPGPVDLGRFRGIEAPGPPNSPIRILFTGAVYGAQADAIANTAKAVDSMDGDAELVIYTATDSHALARFGIAGRYVTVRTPVAVAEIPGLLASADLLLLPFSFKPAQRRVVTTSFPTKVGEYLASRRPVIVHAPSYSTIASMAREEGWGVVVDKPETDLLVGAIREIASDRAAALTITERAWAIAEARHDLDHCRNVFCSSLGLRPSVAPETCDVTIVIVSYNCLEYLQRCLSAVYGYPPSVIFEVIVVDNASSDGTVQWLQHAYPNVVVLTNTENVGYGAAVNIGVRHAGGRQFLLLNPDTQVTEGALNRLLAFARSHESAGVVGPRLVNEDGRPQPSARRFPSPLRLNLEVLRLHLVLPRHKRSRLLMGTYFAQDETRPVDWVSGACHLISRSAWDRIGELTERTFCGFDDLDYCMRARCLGFTNWFCADACVVHRCGATVSARWTSSELDVVAINNVYVILDAHWPKWRVKVHCAAELFGTLSDFALAPESQWLGDTRQAYRARAAARAQLLTRLFLGCVQPIPRCDPIGLVPRQSGL